jgi:hypothetical protein
MLVRLGRDLPAFLGAPISVERARTDVELGLAAREERFLRIARSAIYAQPRSPYRRLLLDAGFGSADLDALVRRRGLDEALARLAEEGVYVTFDELKGRRPIDRGGRAFTVDEGDFDNPLVRPHFEVRSGGTRGRGTSVKMGLPYIADMAAIKALAWHAHGLAAHEHVIWLSMGLNQVLRQAKLGRAPCAWFSPVRRLSWKLRAGSWFVAALSRLSRCPVPAPRFLDLREPRHMADWLVARGRTRGPVCVTTYGSSATRVASAAIEAGLSLAGVTFVAFGEPFTDTKRRTVELAGGRAVASYGMTEAGNVAFACATPRACDDSHVFTHAYAVAGRTRAVANGGGTVEALLLTSLLDTAPKVLLNVESGDHALLDRRACACPLGALGLTTHLTGIRSFEKLSGEGTTFVRADLARILEDVLPAHFGGTADDYQVVEGEDSGARRLLLVVSPRVGPVDEASVLERFIGELGRSGWLEAAHADVWRRAGTVTVRRQWPAATAAGKILPFHLATGSRGD